MHREREIEPNNKAAFVTQWTYHGLAHDTICSRFKILSRVKYVWYQHVPNHTNKHKKEPQQSLNKSTSHSIHSSNLKIISRD